MHGSKTASCPKTGLPLLFGCAKTTLHQFSSVQNQWLAGFVTLREDPLAPFFFQMHRLCCARAVNVFIARSGAGTVIVA